MGEYTIELDGVGPVLFERSKRAKRLNISVRPYTGVRVAVPIGHSFQKAEDFVRGKTDWIRKHLRRIRQIERENDAIPRRNICVNRARARELLLRRLEKLAGENGFTYNRVFLRNQRTRWGSCSAKDNISLNSRLVILPDELIDYVILHELVHTRVKNHSKTFWTELDRLVGNAKGLNAQLKRFGPGFP